MVDVGLKITLVGVDKKKTLVNTCKNKAWLMSTIKPSNDNQKKKIHPIHPSTRFSWMNIHQVHPQTKKI